MLEHRIPTLECAQHCIVLDFVIFLVLSFVVRFLVVFVVGFVAPPTRMVGCRHWGRIRFFLRVVVVVVVAVVFELGVRGVDEDELEGALYESWLVEVDCGARFRLMPFILFTISVGIR